MARYNRKLFADRENKDRYKYDVCPICGGQLVFFDSDFDFCYEDDSIITTTCECGDCGARGTTYYDWSLVVMDD